MSSLEAGVAEALGELRQQFADLRKAFVDEGEERAAREAASSPKSSDDGESVEAAAKRAGLKPAQYLAAIEAAKRTQFKEQFGDTIREILAEISAEKTAGGAGSGDGAASPPKAKTKAKVKEVVDASDDDDDSNADDGDSTPHAPHWSDRPFARIFGGN